MGIYNKYSKFCKTLLSLLGNQDKVNYIFFSSSNLIIIMGGKKEFVWWQLIPSLGGLDRKTQLFRENH